MGNHHMKGGSECPSDTVLEQWSNITLSLRKTYREYISSGQKSFQVFTWLCIRRVENLERRHYGRRH